MTQEQEQQMVEALRRERLGYEARDVVAAEALDGLEGDDTPDGRTRRLSLEIERERMAARMALVDDQVAHYAAQKRPGPKGKKG